MASLHGLPTPPPSPTPSDESACYSGEDDDSSSSSSQRSSEPPSLDLGSEGNTICDSDEEEEEEEERAASSLSITSILEADLESIPEEDAVSADELDGPIQRLFLDTVKYFVTRVLYIAIYEYNKVLCNGCQTCHPSQLEHTCLVGIPPFFLRRYYETLKSQVLTDSFIVAALKLLEKYNIRMSDQKVIQGEEAVLQHLKDAENVVDLLGDIQDELVGGSTLKTEDLQDAVDFWEGRE